MICRICSGEILPPERVTEAGKDYCQRTECIEQAAPRLQVFVVPTHKSTPMLLPAYAPGSHLDARRNR